MNIKDGPPVLPDQRYLPFGQVRTDVGTVTQTDFGYTFQRNLDIQGVEFTIGLMDYKARFYDPYLNRFIQPDSIINPGPQGLNRYSYVSNSPINLVDPSGHYGVCPGTITPTDDGFCGGGIDYGTPPVAPTIPPDPTNDNSNGGGQNDSDVVYILICGDDMGANCTPNLFGYIKYLGNVPLWPYRDWAIRTGMDYYYYATGPCYSNKGGYDLNCLQSSHDQIVYQMTNINGENPLTQFVVIGFSGGAPHATWVAQGTLDAGISGNQLTVIELDSEINQSNNEQSDINNLIEQSVTFVSIVSESYRQNITVPENSIPSYLPHHTQLAINLNVFLYARSYFP